LKIQETPLEFVPYDLAKDRPHILVEGARDDQTALSLSHWPRSGAPGPLRGDTSAEIVFNYLAAPDRARYAEGVQVVTSNAFSQDGAVAVWSLLNPDRALEMRDLLLDVAAAGDFSRYRDPLALKAALTIAVFADPEVSPYRRELSGRSAEGVTAMLYQLLMFGLPDILAHIDDYRDLYEEEFEHVRQSEALLRSGAARIQEFPEVDLAVVESPEPLHPAAVCPATHRLRVLTVHQGMYWLKYRPESWGTASRPVAPRIDLDPLATRLQVMETAPGTWTFDGIDAPAPNLGFVGQEGRPALSGLSKDHFVEELVDYLKAHADDPAMQWNPY
jgi:hypothetical protein